MEALECEMTGFNIYSVKGVKLLCGPYKLIKGAYRASMAKIFFIQIDII